MMKPDYQEFVYLQRSVSKFWRWRH